MGRSSPNDKRLLVQALRKRGDVVAITGDGMNDAPALHEADIGLSMGIQGTKVAKESSDIIIFDDNFAFVVKVVRWGRSVYANIQKFIQFQLTVNATTLIINVTVAVSSGNVPLNAVQVCPLSLSLCSRFVFVLQGVVTLIDESSIAHKLEVDSYAYLPPDSEHLLTTKETVTLVIDERRYHYLENHKTEQIIGSTDKQPLIETPGEAQLLVFSCRI